MGLGWAYSFLSTLAHHLNFMVGPTNKAVWVVLDRSKVAIFGYPSCD